MARAYGWNAKLLLAFETTYGTAPAAGAYKLTPFVSCDLDSAQGLIASNVLGLGRDPSQPYQDVINVDGDDYPCCCLVSSIFRHGLMFSCLRRRGFFIDGTFAVVRSF